MTAFGAEPSVEPAPAPMRPEAKAHYDAGMAAYGARAYRDAIAAFKAAHALDPRREILFAEAQATRLAGDCPAARVLYDAFLATKPPGQQVDAVRIALARCDESARPTAPEPPKPPMLIAPAPPPPPTALERHLPSLVLAGSGVVAIGAGAFLLQSAFVDDDAAARQDVYGDFANDRRSAERKWRWGIAGVLGGSVLLAAGVGRSIWVSLDARARENALVVGGRF
jgi:iron complex outermembrane receptor protein